MSPLLVGIFALIFFVFLMIIGIPIGVAFFVAGVAGIICIRGLTSGLHSLGAAPYAWTGMDALLPIPLFVLMGFFAFYSGISSDLYAAANKWIGRLPGGIALATTLACTGFAACSGDSMSGAATMGSIAYPEMERLKYSKRLSTACIAAGGTLGVLIPPSIGFVLYGFLTQTSIAKLFMAGILPGLLLSGLFCLMIYVMCKRNPRLGPPNAISYSWKEKIVSLRGVWSVNTRIGNTWRFVSGNIYSIRSWGNWRFWRIFNNLS
jgi:C4-dicarboxylate transporter DctM subunit